MKYAPGRRAFFWLACYFIAPSIPVFSQPAPIDEVIYISGGGSARLADIKARTQKLRALFESASSKHRAKVTAYHPDIVIGVRDLQVLTYSQSLKNVIAAKIAAGGPQTHIMASSLGAGELRDHIFDLALKKNPQLHLGTVVSIEPMLPTFGLATQKLTVADGATFDLFVNIELRYRGAAAEAFRTAMGARRYRPSSCTFVKCFYIGEDRATVNDTRNYFDAFVAHGKSIGYYEDQGQVVLTHAIAARNAAEPAFAVYDLRAEMDRWQKENPVDSR